MAKKGHLPLRIAVTLIPPAETRSPRTMLSAISAGSERRPTGFPSAIATIVKDGCVERYASIDKQLT